MASHSPQLPQLAPYPPPGVRTSLSPGDWQACLEAWNLNLEYRLRLNDEHFRLTLSTALDFLSSYLQTQDQISQSNQSLAEHTLQRHVFTFTRRLLKGLHDIEVSGVIHCDLFVLLADFCSVYQSTSALKAACIDIWKCSNTVITAATEAEKIRQIKLMSMQPANISREALPSLRRTTRVVQVMPAIGSILMTGDDYLDTLTSFYKEAITQNADSDQRAVTEVVFVCLRSLLQVEQPQTSLLLDQLFSLKSAVDVASKDKSESQMTPEKSLLSSLICSTSFLQRLRHFFADPTVPHHSRGQSLLSSFETYQLQNSHLHPPPRRRVRKLSKGKSKSYDLAEGSHEMHMHSMTQVSTLQELFPDLPPVYLLRLLDHFENDVESVTAALLEPESLPVDLRNPNNVAEDAHTQQPRPSTVPARKNVFDDDDFSNLKISSSQLHFGKITKIDSKAITDEPVSERSRHKAAIISALAAFDSDDDERDDTYDVADVGGTVDSSVPGTDDAEALPTKRQQGEKGPSEMEKADEILYRAWKDDANAFARDTKTRLGQVRGQFKRELNNATGQNWTDEMIEGWAVMLTRDPGRQRTLESKFSNAGVGFTGGQTRIERTSWRQETDDEADGGSGEGEGGGASGRGAGRSRGRGRGRGRGSNTAGLSSEAATQAARRRKEQRGGGNHSRRDGRAKKVARGFGSAPPS